ncbi:MAG: phosphoethanolamine transferase [Leucothrix sp.]
MKYWHITLIVSVFLTAFTNNTFWAGVTQRLNNTTADGTLALSSSWADAVFLISLFFVLILVTNTLLGLVSFRLLLKPALIILLVISAASAYFMDEYATMIDKDMIINVVSTDLRESQEFFSLTLMIKLLLLGIFPAYLLYRVPIIYPENLFDSVWQRSLMVVLSLSVLLLVILSQYQTFSSFGRNNRDLRHFINPENYLFSLKSLALEALDNGVIVAKPIGTDATLKRSIETRNKPSLVVLVVGETARAANFSLNGYKKLTNPELLQQSLVSFSNTYSCGTATATSLPCMFSHLTRQQYSTKAVRSHQRLPDVIQQAGVDVLWRENNTGCKGNCDRITTHQLADAEHPTLCNSNGCYDEILLEGLDQYINESSGDQLIILHQKGNHGPAYYLRYPLEFERFKPACKNQQLSKCSQAEIVNAYDNALLYTDYLLAKTIQYLKTKSDSYHTAMIYVSDHGESLGESNLYLHGMPYLLAPDVQKHIPFIVWLSQNYQQSYQINQDCLQRNKAIPLSHDHLFSSVLGLLEIQTKIYNQDLDLFARCKEAS